jgi:hypothetical protein
MQIENETPCEVMAVPGYDRDGREAVTIIVKGTFALLNGRMPEPLPPPDRLPIVMADEYWGEPGASPVKCESELAPYKPSADLVLLGHAYAARGRRAKIGRVAFSVGRWGKKARVSSSEAMERIPLYFLERIRGGPKWLRAKRPKDGFGFYPKQCKPRVRFAGTYDDKWRDDRSPFLPADFDFRFFQVAFPGLICDSYLRGGEPIHLGGVTPNGCLDSVLPRFEVDVEVFLDDREEKVPPKLDTLVALPDEGKLVLIWRSLVAIKGSLSRVRGFRIQASQGPTAMRAAP